MAGQGQGDRTISKNLRCNERIRISPIRLIDENNEQAGIAETKDAWERAQELGMDLVEVAPQASPPVCRIMDYGKWKYAQRKKEQKSKAHRHETELKEVRIRTPKIGEHDLMIKVNRARKFLERGDRVQFSLRFRGRELAHIDEGAKVFKKIQEELADVSKIDQHFRREGRRITMTLAALPKEQIGKPPKAPKAPKTAEATPASAAPEAAPAPAEAPEPPKATEAAPTPAAPEAPTVVEAPPAPATPEPPAATPEA